MGFQVYVFFYYVMNGFCCCFQDFWKHILSYFDVEILFDYLQLFWPILIIYLNLAITIIYGHPVGSPGWVPPV